MDKSQLCKFRNLVMILSCFLIFAPNAGLSATFTKAQNNDCRIQMTGQIVKGDLIKLKTAADEFFIASITDENLPDVLNVLCLNSPGGSLGEAMRMADYIYNNSIGTVVHKNQSCLSACAFMFMLGMFNNDDDLFVDRSMHPLGTLGFHKPFFSVDMKKTFSGADMNKSYNLATSALLELMKLASYGQPWSGSPMIKPDLLRTAFNYESDDFFYIDSIEKLGRWEIDILGLNRQNLPKIDRATARLLCENLHKWNFSYGTTSGELDLSEPFLVKEKKSNNGIDYEVGDSTSSLTCKIQTVESKLVSLCGSSFQSLITIGYGRCIKDIDEFEMPPYYFYASDYLALFAPDLSMSSMVKYLDPKQEVSVEQPASDTEYKVSYGQDLKGGDLAVLKSITFDQCTNACRVSKGPCNAATYDRWNSICILKNVEQSSRILLLQPKTDTMVDVRNTDDLDYSLENYTFKRRSDRYFPDDNEAVEKLKSKSRDACELKCNKQSDCHAYSYQSANKMCSTYFFPGEYFPKKGSVIGVKEQLN